MNHIACIEKISGLLRGSHSIPCRIDLIAQALADYGGRAEDYELSEVDDAGLSALISARDLAGLTLEQARERKTQEIAAAAEAFLSPFGREYGATERATWDQQYAEAQAGEGQMLAAIASARGMAVADLAAAIIANRAAWVALAGAVVGQRLQLQDQVDAATTPAGVLAVQPVFSLPV